ncbi:hypothetical protein Tco_0444515 [Tanacetum coccineum]
MNDARSIEQLAQDNARGEDNNESASGEDEEGEEGEEGEQHSSDGDYSSESDATTPGGYVGDANKDHACWERPEDMDTATTVLKLIEPFRRSLQDKEENNTYSQGKEDRSAIVGRLVVFFAVIYLVMAFFI